MILVTISVTIAIFSSSPNVFKQDKTMSLSKIEKVLYKTKYENEPTAQRLSRIESSVFGTNFASDSDSVRMERITSAINAQKSAKNTTATDLDKTWQLHSKSELLS